MSRLMMRRSNQVLAAVLDWVPKVRLTGKASEPSHAISGISKTEESLWMPHCSLQRCEWQASAYDGFEMKCVPAVEREGQVAKSRKQPICVEQDEGAETCDKYGAHGQRSLGNRDGVKCRAR